MFRNKKAKEDSLEDLKSLQEEETAVGSSVVEDATLPQSPDGDSSLGKGANAEAEEVPDENVENLDESEEGGEDTTLPQSPDGDSSLVEGANIDVDAVMAENKAMKEEIENLRKALEQSGELAKESTVAVATGDLGDIDFSAFLYGDDEAKKGAAGKFMEYFMSNLQGRATPVLKEWDEAKRALDVQKAIKVLSSLEDEFPGFGKEADVIEALIGRDKVLASYEDPMQARIAAYLINEGLKAVKKGKAGMSVDELMELYRKNEEFKAAIEQDRLEQLKEAPQIPPMPVSSSLSTHEPYTADTPKDMEAANKSLRELRKKYLK